MRVATSPAVRARVSAAAAPHAWELPGAAPTGLRTVLATLGGWPASCWPLALLPRVEPHAASVPSGMSRLTTANGMRFFTTGTFRWRLTADRNDYACAA